MPKVSEAPPGLRAFLFHGVDLSGRAGTEQALGDCPLCGKEKHFFVNLESGLFDCKVCGASGNPSSFLAAYWEVCYRARHVPSDYAVLARDRGLLDLETLRAWGVCKSLLTDEWLVPGYSAGSREVSQLYRYTEVEPGGKRLLLATPGPELHQQLFGLGESYGKDRDQVYLAEGPWDGMVLWETLRRARKVLVQGNGDSKLVATARVKGSLGEEVNVLAVPGAAGFNEAWRVAFAGRKVTLLYDSDHPRKTSAGQEQPPAGFTGLQHACSVLGEGEGAPAEVSYLSWGPSGYDPALPSGYDLRDHLTGARGAVMATSSVTERVASLSALLDRILPVPADWRKAKERARPQLEPLDCREWKELIKAWRRALTWTEGLDRALSVMLAVATSTKCVGDQLWAKIISPPSGGKSTLCEALSVDRRHVVPKSTIRGFHSGFGTGGEDNSLVSKLYDKTLVTKDGDTLLQQPNLGQILAEARDLYDSTSRTHYRNRTSRDYQGVRMTWILCGTSSLRQIDSSELGERFLDCVIMEGIDEELEDSILLRVAHKAERCLDYQANGKAEGQHDPDLVKAMQLTGGYLGYLRDYAHALLPRIKFPVKHLQTCTDLGKFVAFMRARPSTKQEETAEREFAARLVSQMVRLAKCLAVVLNATEVDEEVMRRTRQCALDTARGRTLELARAMYSGGVSGTESKALAVMVSETPEKTGQLLRFLRRIGAAELYRPPSNVIGIRHTPRWRLTPRLVRLWEEVVGKGPAVAVAPLPADLGEELQPES